MLAWELRYGRPPSSYDWSRTHARRRGGEALRRLNHGRWPSASVVTGPANHQGTRDPGRANDQGPRGPRPSGHAGAERPSGPRKAAGVVAVRARHLAADRPGVCRARLRDRQRTSLLRSALSVRRLAGAAAASRRARGCRRWPRSAPRLPPRRSSCTSPSTASPLSSRRRACCALPADARGRSRPRQKRPSGGFPSPRAGSVIGPLSSWGERRCRRERWSPALGA